MNGYYLFRLTVLKLIISAWIGDRSSGMYTLYTEVVLHTVVLILYVGICACMHWQCYNVWQGVHCVCVHGLAAMLCNTCVQYSSTISNWHMHMHMHNRCTMPCNQSHGLHVTSGQCGGSSITRQVTDSCIAPCAIGDWKL